MNKPLIGIPAKQRNPRDNDPWHYLEMADDMRYQVVKKGGLAIMLLPSEKTLEFNQNDFGDEKILSEEEIADLRRQVDLCDGIIMQGGLYSCSYEVEIARYALEKDLPMIGICAGFNNILRALGINVREDKSGAHNIFDINYRHHIKVVKDSLLYEFTGSEDYEVNSFHTMIADPEVVETVAKINACSDDGLVEAYEVEGKRFVLGMKWHPELMDGSPLSEKLFTRFVDECRKS